MDVSNFLGGNWLTQGDLPALSVVWTIREVSQQLVGGQDQKICIRFDQHAKLLGCNKTNLTVIAQRWGVESAAWIGQQLELYRDTTFYQGQQMPCIRVRIPQQPAMAPQPAAAPVAPPQPAQQPAAAPAPQPVQPPAQQPQQPPPPQQGSQDAPPWA